MLLLLLLLLSGLVVSSSYARDDKSLVKAFFTIQFGVWGDWPICYHRSKQRRAAAAAAGGKLCLRH